MNHEAISQLFFEERVVMGGGETGRCPSPASPRKGDDAMRRVGAIATDGLVSALESLCVAALTPYVDATSDAVAAARVDCCHGGPVVAGSEVRITGWVERMGDRDVCFRVQAQDQQGQVCAGTILLVVVPRRYLERVLGRKRDAMARRALFAAS